MKILNRLRFFNLALLAPLLLTAQMPAHAQDSSRPLRIIVGFAAGGSVDSAARAIAPLLEAKLEQPVVVDNRPGGNGVVAVQSLLGAPADGNAVYLQATSVITKVFIRDFQIDVLKDMQPVSPLWNVSYFLLTNNSVPANNVKEFIDYAKNRQGKLNYAASTASGMLTMETLKARAGIDIVSIPYKGSAPSVVAMLANDVQSTFDTIGIYKPHVDSGKMRALVYTGKQRSPVLPMVPTAAEAGLPGLEMALTAGMWTKAGAPISQVNRINAAINEIVNRPDIKRRFEEIGLTAIGGSAADLQRQVFAEMGFWETAAKVANFKPE